MMLLNIVTIVLLSSVVQSGIVDHQSQRVLSGKPLSDKERHEEDGDYEYDHDAFLGEDQAEYFDTLTPDESQRRLGLICDRIDIDGDGNISQEELRRFVIYQFVLFVIKHFNFLQMDKVCPREGNPGRH